AETQRRREDKKRVIHEGHEGTPRDETKRPERKQTPANLSFCLLFFHSLRLCVSAVQSQNGPRRRSFAGSTSRHVVHQPVSTVSTSSAGRPSARISAARRSWSYGSATTSTRSCGSAESRAYHTFVRPSFSGRPSTPTLTKWRSPGRGRCHLMPVCVART